MKFYRILSLLVLFAVFARPAKPASISVPFTIDRVTGSIQITCETESQPGKVLRCTIDTGAQKSIGDSAAVSKASMHSATLKVIQTSAGDQSAYETPQVLIVQGLRIPVTLEITAGLRRLNADILIGEDFLRQFPSVTVDYKNHFVTFETE